MENINSKYINDVKDRYLPLPRSVVEEYEHEPNMSDFETIKKLGYGSFGKIYLVMHKKTRAKYALKIINKSDDIREEQKKYCKKEVEILYKCNHPNIVKLYGHFEDKDSLYYVMEYFPNGSAYDLIPKNGKRQENVELIASVMKDIINAIYYLHNMNPKIMHRDIKPENVLLDENKKAHLIDFGWSNYLINNRKRNTICGTPLYSPPEMITNKGHDEKLDIWCIGVLLFELLTGDVPFDGNDEETVKRNIVQLNITWPTYAPPDAKDLILKILKVEPNERPTIETIITHNFFKKYFPNAINELIKPDKNKTKIFVISTDDPKTWNQLKNTQNTYTKKMNTENKIFKKTPKENKENKEYREYREHTENKTNKTKNCLDKDNNQFLDNQKTQLKIRTNYLLSPLRNEGSPPPVKRNLNLNFFENNLYQNDYKLNINTTNISNIKNTDTYKSNNNSQSKNKCDNKTFDDSNSNSKSKSKKEITNKTNSNHNFCYFSEYKNNANNKCITEGNDYSSKTNTQNKYNTEKKLYIKVNPINTSNNSIIYSNNTSIDKRYKTLTIDNSSIQNNKFSSLLKRYEALRKEYDTLKKNKLDKLRNELKDLDKKLLQYLSYNKSSYDFENNKYRNNKSNQYKYTYERLKTENNELKEKIKKYSHYLRRKSGTENDQKLFNVIKEKELMINKYKKEIIDRRIKERERFFMLINKYDKTLISQENENKTLKMRLKELERQIH